MWYTIARVRDPSQVAKFCNFMRSDSCGYPVSEFVNALDHIGLLDDEGIKEVSRFCVVKGDLICHYEYSETWPSATTAQTLHTMISTCV